MNKIIDIFARAYQKKLTLIVIQTLRVLFPLILLGSFAEVIKLTFLTPTGYIATLFAVPDWLPFVDVIARILGTIYHCTIDLIALYSAYAIAYQTAKAYQLDPALPSLLGGASFILLAYRPNGQNVIGFNERLLSQGMLIALVCGYVSVRLLLFVQKKLKKPQNAQIVTITLILLGAAVLNYLLRLLGELEVPTYVASTIMKNTAGNAFLYVVLLGFLTDLLSFIGMGGPFSMSPTFTDATSFANLNHALKTGAAYGVPYPFTDTTLFHSYANFGGNGVLLALVIAIALTAKTADHKYKSVTKWSLFPTLFNNHYPLMLGLPILFNPLLFIPFILAPLVNMLIAGAFIALDWIPTAAYPVPAGTPGPLIAFIGTNGNFLALGLGILLLILDVLLYLPFVKLAEKIKQRAGEYDV